MNTKGMPTQKIQYMDSDAICGNVGVSKRTSTSDVSDLQLRMFLLVSKLLTELSMPRVRSMMKKNMAKKVEPGRVEMASG